MWNIEVKVINLSICGDMVFVLVSILSTIYPSKMDMKLFNTEEQRVTLTEPKP